MSPAAREPASFRDPAGFVFRRGGNLFRQVNRSHAGDYDRLIGSGLYRDLADAGLLVRHEEVDDPAARPGEAHRVLRPERLRFISHPYEWCFGQFKAAARLTLEVQRRALAAGMSLKDASAFNVQFRGTRPLFIDTLSFEPYREGEPWPAYGQFCRHFLAPLALMGLVDPRLGQLLRPHLDGVPLDLTARLLPWHSRLRPSLLLHLHLHARAQRGGEPGGGGGAGRAFGRAAMLGLVDSLARAVGAIEWTPPAGGWADYVDDNSYTDAARARKRRLVAEFLDHARPALVWDLGANTGEYSRIAAARGATTVAFDLDPSCVERNYREAAARDDPHLLPLLTDLTNPSPGVGWQHRERASLLGRGPADVALALALVHHLAIARNVPLDGVAGFFARAARRLIVEFVPRDDPQVGRLLAGRADIFHDYHRDGFEAAFRRRFEFERVEPIPDGGRVLYLMRRRGEP